MILLNSTKVQLTPIPTRLLTRFGKYLNNRLLRQRLTDLLAFLRLLNLTNISRPPSSTGKTIHSPDSSGGEITPTYSPAIANVAKVYLSTVATSVPSERIFSKAGELISAKRKRVKPKNVNTLLFLNKY